MAHYLPNGHRVSRADLDPGMRGGYGAGRGAETPQYGPQDVSFNDAYLQQTYATPDYFPGQDLPFLEDDQDAYNDRYNQYQNNTNYDSGVGSPPTSQFGSPPGDSMLHKQGTDNMRSALNAPLPASFDANSLPHIAKFGPFGQSVPDKFGMRSPPSSNLSKNMKLGSPPETITTPTNRLSNIGSTLRNISSPLSMSPQNADDATNQKVMHSQKMTKPRMISASVPRTSLQGWNNDDIGAEADLLPSSLHDDVMLPQEKMRRLSRPDQPLSSSAREGSNGLNIPTRSPGHMGSPPTGSSPSRFRAFFDEQRKKDEAANSTTPFGHVGSPLRESWMPHETSEGSRNAQISGISQAMAQMALNRTDSSETNGSTRPLPGLRSTSGFSRFDRTISSPGMSGRKIDEDPGEGAFFEMDDENNKRHSAWSMNQGSGLFRDKGSDDSTRPEAPQRFSMSNGIRPIFGFGQP